MTVEDAKSAVAWGKQCGLIIDPEPAVAKLRRQAKVKLPPKKRKPPQRFECRWCNFQKPRRSRCSNCGKRSNTWSVKRAEVSKVSKEVHMNQYEQFRLQEMTRYTNAVNKAIALNQPDLAQQIKPRPNGRFSTIGPRSYQRAADKLLQALAIRLKSNS